ncbi:MAG: ergothioneine biosynthesis protein EgtB [Bradymonadaceae bacterium]
MTFSNKTNNRGTPENELSRRFDAVRSRTTELAGPLPVEDQLAQTMEDVSPTRWHLAHTTWFFETFLLRRFVEEYRPFAEGFDFLFNSYYQGAGAQFNRARRGTLGRPTTAEIGDYRSHVDDAIRELLRRRDDEEIAALIEVGLQHEQQHQELILTDIKHVLASNPLRPAYRADCAALLEEGDGAEAELGWFEYGEGVFEIGHQGPGFCFDNERPRHKVFVHPFELASRPVTCGEFVQFMTDGGYDDPRWWLSEGWAHSRQERWSAPLYWERRGDEWCTMTLGGMRRVDAREPVSHVSYFEADAYARWAGARLPTEAEWELASEAADLDGNFADEERFHPRPPPAQATGEHPDGLFGDVWEWTASPYTAYPGFKPWEGVLGEYNGKFMCNQFILRGGSCATPASHIRRTYRNFFPPHVRWQFKGFRLARWPGF